MLDFRWTCTSQLKQSLITKNTNGCSLRGAAFSFGGNQLTAASPDSIRSHHFLRIKDVRMLTALSPSHIYALQAKGQFPRSRKIAGKVSVWLSSDVTEWMQQKWEQAA
jgi:predicted DNA-binding transcriptional regulator AlpA